MPDLLNFFLVGDAAAEYTIASTSQFLNPASETWETRIFERLGLPVGLLPPLVRPGAARGRLLPEQAAELGLPSLIVRACAAHDTASAVAAVPVRDDGLPWAFISSGTWSLVGVEIPRPLLTEDARRANATNEAGVGGTTRLLKNVTGLWLAQRLRHDLALRGQELDHEALASAAAAAPAFQRFIAPNAPAFHNPPNMLAAIADFCLATGQPPPQSPGEYARCIFESLAFSYAEVLAALARLVGMPFARVHIIGGGAQNAFLNACAANACGIEVVAGPHEATVIGNGLVQAMADGLFGTLVEARQAVGRSFPVTVYPPRDHEMWQRHYSRYREAIQAAAGRY
jgi:rhamnulokinase